MAEFATLGVRGTARQAPVYTIPRRRRKSLPAGYTGTVRIDRAREALVGFMPSRHVYRHSGEILDDWFALEQAITPGEPLYLYVEGVVPGGCAVALSIEDQDGRPSPPRRVLATLDTATGQTVTRSCHAHRPDAPPPGADHRDGGRGRHEDAHHGALRRLPDPVYTPDESPLRR